MTRAVIRRPKALAYTRAAGRTVSVIVHDRTLRLFIDGREAKHPAPVFTVAGDHTDRDLARHWLALYGDRVVAREES